MGQWLESRGQQRLYPAIIAGLLVGGVVTAPMALPILPLETSDRMIDQLFGFAIDDPAMLTSEFHDQYGWEEQVTTINEAYRSLSPTEQTRAVILTGKYNQASAINFFGDLYNLPPAVSGHMIYYLWGPNQRSNEVIIAYGIRRDWLNTICGEITAAAKTFHPLAPKDNNNLPVYVCRFPKKSLQEIWPELKLYDHLGRSHTKSLQLSATAPCHFERR